MTYPSLPSSLPTQDDFEVYLHRLKEREGKKRAKALALQVLQQHAQARQQQPQPQPPPHLHDNGRGREGGSGGGSGPGEVVGALGWPVGHSHTSAVSSPNVTIMMQSRGKEEQQQQ